MKYLFIFIVFFYSSLHSQTRKKTDSIAFYADLVSQNVKINNTKKAAFYTQKVLHFCRHNKNLRKEAQLFFKLGKIYYTNNSFREASENFHKSISLHKSILPTPTLAASYCYLGLTNIKKEQHILAEIYFKKSESIYKDLGINNSSYDINLKKGISYKLKKQYHLATIALQKIIKNPDTLNDLKTKSEAFYQLGIIKNSLQKSDSALYYLENALHINAKANDIEQKSRIILALSQSYKEKKDFDRAYSYLDEHYQLKDRISKIKISKKSAADFAKFKEKELLNARLEKEEKNREEQKANKYSKLISILAIALITILSLLSLALYKNNIIRNESNLLLKEKNNELIIAKNKAEKASLARSEFLSTVSHELRTPLNAINGITHLLLKEKPKKSQINYLSSLQFSGNYLAKFINEILEINKIESNKTEIENIPFDLRELLKNIKNCLQELAYSNNNSFHLEIDNALPDFIIGDPTKLSQIFLNLINNALKFTKNGTVTVIAKQDISEQQNTSIYFEVMDTGIGIPEEKQQTVFESFSQGSIEVNRKYGGTGLGLTIVKKLIKILGGQIKLKSTVGIGSSFSFSLQFKTVSETIVKPEKPKKKQTTSLSNKKILLIEDNKINQMITKKMLENKAILCEIIDNGEDAIEAVRHNKYDLILMDVHLPGINGTIATQKIREFDTTTPVIALTAISLHENREMLLSFGMNDVITKPFVPDDFYATISKHI
jgi:signal transduction histidine kinase/CheY-like chemotaxis protein/mannose/fructose/N-acetylgalactosamine-specific phosphotransferase system component IIB